MANPDRSHTLQATQSRYESEVEVAAYTTQAQQGLLPEEKAVLARTAVSPCRTLVLGCGAGREAISLAERGYEVVGTDISRPMLAAARALSASRIRKPEYVLMADPLLLPFAADSFALVAGFAQFLAQIPGRKTRVTLLDEVARVLVPGGLLIGSIADRRAFADLEQAPAEGDGDLADEPMEEGDIWVWDTSEAKLKEPQFFHLHTPGELTWELKKGGLHLRQTWLGSELTEKASPDAHRYRFYVAEKARPGTVYKKGPGS